MQPVTDVKKQLAITYLSDGFMQHMHLDALQIYEVISKSINDQDVALSQNSTDKLLAEQPLNQRLVAFWFKWLAEEGYGGKNNNPCFDNICFDLFRFVLQTALNSTYVYSQLIKNFITKYPVFCFQKLNHIPLYSEFEQSNTMASELRVNVPSLRELIRNKMGLFSQQAVALTVQLPKDLIGFISINPREILINVSKLIKDRRLFVSENKLKLFHELYCILNSEQDFFEMLMEVYKTELYYQNKYGMEQLYIREQYKSKHTVEYNRKRHLTIDKYLHKYFGISGFVTDIFFQLLIGPHAPIDNFEMLVKLFCIKLIYENNRKDAKINLMNTILIRDNPYYPEGIFKEDNNHLFLRVMRQWLDLDVFIEQQLHELSLHPVPIEGFPDTVEGYREKGHSWAVNKLSWPAVLSKYLFDEPPGLNDDVFTFGLESEDPETEHQISLAKP